MNVECNISALQIQQIQFIAVSCRTSKILIGLNIFKVKVELGLSQNLVGLKSKLKIALIRFQSIKSFAISNQILKILPLC